MGSFVGHVIPGALFVLLAIWWLIDILRDFFKPDSREFRSRLIIPYRCCGGRRVPVIAWVVFIACLLGIITEMVFSPMRAKSKPGGPNVQHATMYFFFGLVGFQSLLIGHYWPSLPERRQLDYTTIVFAMTAEALLFMFHLDGRLPVDITMHTLLVYTVYASIVITLFELRYEDSVVLAMGRSFFTLLQGTWFIQIAYTLYNPWEDPWGKILNNAQPGAIPTALPNQLIEYSAALKATSIFCWHVGLIFILYIIIFVFCHWKWPTSHLSDASVLDLEAKGCYSKLEQDEVIDT